jgi:hypothetical protein
MPDIMSQIALIYRLGMSNAPLVALIFADGTNLTGEYGPLGSPERAEPKRATRSREARNRSTAAPTSLAIRPLAEELARFATLHRCLAVVQLCWIAACAT